MKLTLLPALITGAGLLQVGAVPLRVLIVSSSQGVSAPTNIRFGHAVSAGNSGNVAMLSGPHTDGPFGNRRPCGRGGRFREKSIEISNIFRQALGLPLIETNPHPHHHHHHKDSDMIKVLPWVGTPPSFIEVKPGPEPARNDNVRIYPVSNLPHPHSHHISHHHDESTLIMRIQGAIASLGLWEGSIVAFVLGCGLGVLIRMFFVLTVVVFRSIRGKKESDEYTYVNNDDDYDTEEILVPPPCYVYVDTKVPVVEDAVPKAPAEESK